MEGPEPRFPIRGDQSERAERKSDRVELKGGRSEWGEPRVPVEVRVELKWAGP